MQLRTLLLGASAALLATLGGLADAGAQAKKKPEVFEIGPIVVTARPTRPSAIVELGKILPDIEIEKIRKPFITKIEEALVGEPF